MKLSCCESSYFGIPQKAFENLISRRVLVNGDFIPCLHCAKLYHIENYQLNFQVRLSKDVYVAIMKKIASDFYDECTETSLDAGLKSIYDEFKGMQL